LDVKRTKNKGEIKIEGCRKGGRKGYKEEKSDDNRPHFSLLDCIRSDVYEDIFFQSLPITVEKNGSLRDIVNALNLSGVAVLDDEVADISKLGDFQMLFIDNLWFQSKKMDNSTITWLKGHMLNGVPIIVFGPPEIDEDFLYSLANAQTRETTNHPIIAQGFYIKNERQSWLFIAGTELTQDKVKDAYNWALGEKK